MSTTTTLNVTNHISLVAPTTVPLTGVLRYRYTPVSAKLSFQPEVRIALLGTTLPGAALNVYFDPVVGRSAGPPIIGNSPAARYTLSYLPAGTQPSTTVKTAAIVGDSTLDVNSLSNLTAYNDYLIVAPETNVTAFTYIGATWAAITTGGTMWQATTVVGDAVYFWGHASTPWNHILHTVNAAAATVNAAVRTQWQYSRGSGVWGDLTPYLTGDQTQFSMATPTYQYGCLPVATGVKYTGWTTPSDWAADTVGASPVTPTLGMWVRCVCTTGGAIGTRPTTNAQYTGRLYNDSEWRKFSNIAASPVTLGGALEFAHGTTHEVHPAQCYTQPWLFGGVPYDIVVGNTAATGSPITVEVVATTEDSYTSA